MPDPTAPATASTMDMTPIILFFHSLLRWGILLTVAVAGIALWRGASVLVGVGIAAGVTAGLRLLT